ncbi:MAG: MFS transporter [Acidothermus cellulolyticus]|nr:MFS transporter [Acidothermus cellulolyticus]
MTAAPSAASLWRHRNFRRLWIGETVSHFGTQVSVVAIPLVAVTTLHAGALAVGLLSTLETIAFAVLGLPAGAWCDRWRRRPVLITADVGRAVALATVPIAAAFHVLTFGQLCAVVTVSGVLTVFFDVDYQAFLPTLVGRDHVVAANGALEASRSAAALGGPSLGGLLAQLFTAPYAVAADAVSFAWSAAWIAAIDAAEVRKPRAQSSTGREILDGLRFVFGHRLLRMLAGSTASFNLFNGLTNAVVVLFLVRTVGLSAGSIGVLFSAAGLGGLAGALVTHRLNRALGYARMIRGSAAIVALLAPLLPLTDRGWRLSLFVVWSLVGSAAIAAYNIATVSLRQVLCPPELLGRMNATMRFVVWGTLPLGSLLGGALGANLGLRGALWVAAIGTLGSPAWVFASPLRAGQPVTEGVF